MEQNTGNYTVLQNLRSLHQYYICSQLQSRLYVSRNMNCCSSQNTETHLYFSCFCFPMKLIVGLLHQVGGFLLEMRTQADNRIFTSNTT